MSDVGPSLASSRPTPSPSASTHRRKPAHPPTTTRLHHPPPSRRITAKPNPPFPVRLSNRDVGLVDRPRSRSRENIRRGRTNSGEKRCSVGGRLGGRRRHRAGRKSTVHRCHGSSCRMARSKAIACSTQSRAVDYGGKDHTHYDQCIDCPCMC